MLLVDDEDRVREIAAASLQELGYTVLHTSSGSHALELLSSNPQITLLMTDILMPGIGGRQLVDAALKVRPDLKVLFMTGYTRSAVVHNGMLDQGVNFLPKPFTLEELGNKMRQVLS